jgi:hypothetical protein
VQSERFGDDVREDAQREGETRVEHQCPYLTHDLRFVLKFPTRPFLGGQDLFFESGE